MNLSVTQRLLLMSAVSILSLVLLALAGYFAAQAPQQSLKRFQTDIEPGIALLNDLERDFLDSRRLLAVHVIELYDTKKKEDAAALKTLRQRIEEDLTRYSREMVGDEKERVLLETIRKEVETFDGSSKTILQKSDEFDLDSARDLLAGDNNTQGSKVIATIQALRSYNDQEAKSITEAANHKTLLLNEAAGFIAVLGIVVTAVIGMVLIRGIRNTLNTVQGTVDYIESELDFTRRIPVVQRDELGHIAATINRLIERVRDNLHTITQNAQALASSSSQMAQAAGQVADASQQQSEAASSMAATIEEMTVSVNHVADRAQEANELSSASSQLAANGEQVIGQTVLDINDIAQAVREASTRIHELVDHSARITKVVAVIKEVADQTNLLALNAAIEAARAGEQGRGFAVVADEVRKLAERTAQSTQEIGSTISAMRVSTDNAVACMSEAVSRVGTGVSGAEETSQAIQQIRSGSNNAVQMVEEIAHSIREQGVATHSIAGQVEKIAQMSEQSSAAATQSANAAQQLDDLATELHRVVSAYKL